MVSSLVIETFFAPTQVGQLDAFQIDAQGLEDRLSARQSRKVTHDGFAAIAVTRCLNSSNTQDATHLVDHQRCECFAFDVFSDNQQGLLGLAGGFEQRNQFLVGADLFFEQEDVAIIQFDGTLSALVNEVRRQEAAIELHTFDNVDSRFAVRPSSIGDHAIFANLQKTHWPTLHRLQVVVAGDRGNLFDFFLVLFRRS